MGRATVYNAQTDKAAKKINAEIGVNIIINVLFFGFKCLPKCKKNKTRLCMYRLIFSIAFRTLFSIDTTHLSIEQPSIFLLDETSGYKGAWLLRKCQLTVPEAVYETSG